MKTVLISSVKLVGFHCCSLKNWKTENIIFRYNVGLFKTPLKPPHSYFFSFSHVCVCKSIDKKHQKPIAHRHTHTDQDKCLDTHFPLMAFLYFALFSKLYTVYWRCQDSEHTWNYAMTKNLTGTTYSIWPYTAIGTKLLLDFHPQMAAKTANCRSVQYVASKIPHLVYKQASDLKPTL